MKIPDFVIQRIRQANEDLMPERVVIRRWKAIGGGERDLATVAVDVPAVITPGAGAFRNVADRFQGITPYTLGLPWDTDIRPGDEVVDEAARTFHVRDARKPSSYLVRVRVLADLVND